MCKASVFTLKLTHYTVWIRCHVWSYFSVGIIITSMNITDLVNHLFASDIKCERSRGLYALWAFELPANVACL